MKMIRTTITMIAILAVTFVFIGMIDSDSCGDEDTHFTVAPVAAENLRYTGENQNLIGNEPAANRGTIKYFVSEIEYVVQEELEAAAAGHLDVKAEASGFGTHYVFYMIDDENPLPLHTGHCLEVTIGKAIPNTTVNPIDNLVYNGNYQKLVNAGTADVEGTFEYSFFESAGYSSAIPEQQQADYYTIYYNFTPDDTVHYESVNAVPVMNIQIRKAPVANVTTTYNPTYQGNVYTQTPALTNLSFGGMTPAQGPAENNVTIVIKNGYDGKSAGEQKVVVTVGGDYNFENGSTDVTYTINKATLNTVSVDTIDYKPVYDGSSHIPGFDNIYFDYWSQNNGPAENKISISLKEGSDGITAGEQHIIVTVTGDTNFNDFTGEAKYNIDKADSDIVITGVPNLKYDSPDKHLVTRQGNEEQRVRFDLNGGGGDYSIPKFTDAGTYTVGYHIEASTNYNEIDWQSVEVTVAKADSDIVITGVPNLKYDSPDKHLVTRQGNEEQRVMYTVGGIGESYAIPIFTDAKTYTVGYHIEASTNYNEKNWQSVEVTVAKADATISLDSKNGICQGDNKLTPTVQLQGQMVFDGTIVVTYYTNEACTEGGTTDAPKNVGSYWVVATIPDQTNYNFAISNKTTLIVKHEMVHVDKDGNIAEHYDCNGCHKHFLDADGEHEYFFPDANNEIIFDSAADTDKTDPTKAKADVSGTYASVDVAIAENPDTKVVSEIKTTDENVATIATEASQIKTLADKGAYVKMANTLSSAEFAPEVLKELDLTSGDFEFSAKTGVVPEKYKDKVGQDGVVVDLNLNVAGGAVTKFKDKVTITVAYTLTEGADVSKLKVLYLGEDGIEAFDCIYDENAKTVSFETDHFSEYAIVNNYVDDNGGGSHIPLIIIIAAIAVIAFSAAFILVRAKVGKY